MSDFEKVTCHYCQSQQVRAATRLCAMCSDRYCDTACGLDCPACDERICGSCVKQHSVDCWQKRPGITIESLGYEVRYKFFQPTDDYEFAAKEDMDVYANAEGHIVQIVFDYRPQ